MPGLYSHTTRATGTILTATIYNTDHQNHIDNDVPAMMDDYSSTVSQMQSVTDPGEVGSESQATSLAGEIERLRFCFKELKGTAQWYVSRAIIGSRESVHKTAAYTVASGDTGKLITASATGGAFTITLPLVATGGGHDLDVIIKKSDTTTAAITVAVTGSDNIEGNTTLSLSQQWDSVHVIGDGDAVFYVINSLYSTKIPRTDTAQSWTAAQRATPSALTLAGTVTADWSLSNNFTLTCSTTFTLGNGTNAVSGQSGTIRLFQSTVVGTISYGSAWKFPGGSAPALTTTTGAIDLLSYFIHTATEIHGALTRDLR